MYPEDDKHELETYADSHEREDTEKEFGIRTKEIELHAHDLVFSKRYDPRKNGYLDDEVGDHRNTPEMELFEGEEERIDEDERRPKSPEESAVVVCGGIGNVRFVHGKRD